MIFLLAAIVLEVLWATMLKLSNGMSALLTLVPYLLSLFCLGVACRQLPLSTVYAIWAGAGAVLIAGLGVALFREPLGIERCVGLVLVVVGTVVLLGLEQRVPSGGTLARDEVRQ